MENPCINFKDEASKKLANLPSKWRQALIDILVKFVQQTTEIDCDSIKACQTTTSISDFTVTDTQVCLTFRDEQDVEVVRCFDFSEVINHTLDGLDPKCIATPTEWSNLTYAQRIQKIIDGACANCGDLAEPCNCDDEPPYDPNITYHTEIWIWKDPNIIYTQNGRVEVQSKNGTLTIYSDAISNLPNNDWTIKEFVFPNTAAKFTGPHKVIVTDAQSSLGTVTVKIEDNNGHQQQAYTNLTVTGYADNSVQDPAKIYIYLLDPTTTVKPNPNAKIRPCAEGCQPDCAQIGGIDTSSDMIVHWGWMPTNTALTESQIQASSNFQAITAEEDYTLSFAGGAGSPQYLWFAEPLDATAKTKWADTIQDNNIGSIGTGLDLFGAPITVGGYRFYITNYQTQQTNPIQFKKV